MSQFQEDTFATNIVNGAIEDIWAKASDIIDSNWLQSIDIPIAVDMTMLKLEKIVAWSILDHDGSLSAVGNFEQRSAEQEPTPALIDPWARGTGPI